MTLPPHTLLIFSAVICKSKAHANHENHAMENIFILQNSFESEIIL